MTPDAVISLGERPEPAPLMLQLDTEHDRPARAREWLRQHVVPGYKLSAYLDDRHPDTPAVLEACRIHMTNLYAQSRTMEDRGAQWGASFLETLKIEPPFATSADRPMQGRPVVVVGAGPSLDDNGHHLADFQAKGGAVIASNTSAGACVKHGCMPDIVVCVENRDVSSGLAATEGNSIHVLGMNACAANWEAPARAKLAIVHTEVKYIPYLLQLGTIPLGYTGSVTCAAAALAHFWGASPLILMGQDMALRGESMYAQGTPFDDTRLTYSEGEVELRGESKQIRPLPTMQAPGWHGEPVVSTHILLQFWAWFEKVATTTTIINCTEGGAHIRGSVRLTAEQALAALDTQPPIPEMTIYEPRRHKQVLAGIRRQALETLEAQPLTAPADFPLLHMWTVPEISRLNRTTHDPAERAPAMRAAVVRGCEEIVERTEGY